MTFFFFLKKGEVSREETGNKRTAWSLNRFKKKMSPVNQNDWKLRLKKAKFPLFTLLLCTTHTYKRLNRLKTATDDVIGHIQSSNWSNTSLLQYVEKKKKTHSKTFLWPKMLFFFLMTIFRFDVLDCGSSMIVSLQANDQKINITGPSVWFFGSFKSFLLRHKSMYSTHMFQTEMRASRCLIFVQSCLMFNLVMQVKSTSWVKLR